MSEKTIFVIPGYKQKITQIAYREIAKLLQKECYSPLLVPIFWKNTTISENTKEFVTFYKSIRAKRKYILGFSFGAMIAFLASTKVRPTGLILCSLSPYFKEDLVKKSFASFATGFRYRDFSRLESSKLAKKLKTKQILMLYGEKETKSLVTRVTETFDHIPSGKKLLLTVRQTGHDIGSKRYLRTIHQAAKQLN